MKIQHILHIVFCLASVLAVCLLCHRTWVDVDDPSLLDVILTALCAGHATMRSYVYIKTQSGVEIWEWDLHADALEVGSFWPITMWVVLPMAFYVFLKSLATPASKPEPPLSAHV